MLKSGIYIGKIAGITIRLNYSWFIVFALVTWALASSYFPSANPDWSLATSVIAGLVTSVLFFGSVLAHELMHSIVARSRGIPVRSITLFIFGGVSEITEEPKQPRDELHISLAGPLTSIALGVIFGVIWFLSRDVNDVLVAVSFWLGLINISLAVFNLIPGFPLDGGRVLRSILWARSGNIRSATHTASNIGRGAGFIFIFGGIYLIFTGNFFDGLWLAFIGWFLENAAVGSYRQLALTEILQGHKVSEIMSRECIIVRPETSVEKLVNEQILTTGRRCFPVMSDGQVSGMVSIHDIKAVPRDRWPTTSVSQIMTPFDKLKHVSPDDDLSKLMSMLIEDNINQVPVVKDQSVVGVVARDNLLNFISTRSELGM